MAVRSVLRAGRPRHASPRRTVGTSETTSSWEPRSGGCAFGDGEEAELPDGGGVTKIKRGVRPSRRMSAGLRSIQTQPRNEPRHLGSVTRGESNGPQAGEMRAPLPPVAAQRLRDTLASIPTQRIVARWSAVRRTAPTGNVRLLGDGHQR